MVVMTLNIYLFGDFIFDIDNNHPQWLLTEPQSFTQFVSTLSPLNATISM